jgi:hypothetical protein
MGAGSASVFKQKDHLAQNMATMFLMKEGGSVPAAQSAAQIFQAVLQKHLIVDKSLLNKLVQLPQTSLQEKIAGLAPNFTEILGASKPDLAYFTDPNQNQLADFTNFLTQVAGRLGACMHACLHVLMCLNNLTNSTSSCPLRQDGNTLATISGPNFINDAACLIGTANTGVSIAPAAINIIPELINVVPEGVGVFPQGDFAAQPLRAC